MQTSVSIIAETPTGSSVPRSKAALHSSETYSLGLRLRPATLAAIATLDQQTEYFYSQLCYYDEPAREWLKLPPRLQKQIDAGAWDESISQLTIAFLLIVAEVAQ